MIDLTELDLASDELGEISLESPGDYQRQTDPAPPPEANYGFRAVEASFDKDPTTQERRFDVVEGRKYPVILIPQVEIVEPDEVDGQRVGGRKVGIFQRIRTRPINRLGSSVNELTDLLLAFDANVTFSSIEEGLVLLNGFIQNGTIFRGRGRWRAFDSAYANAEYDKLGGRENASKEETKRILKVARIVGAKRFPLAKDGKTRLGQMVGPSGETLTAKWEISRLYPSDEKVTLGK